MKYDAVILAGGENSSDLRKIAPYDNEALIIIGNYPMIYYVYKSLRSSPLVENIIVSGPADSLRSILPREDNLYFVNGGENAIDSFISEDLFGDAELNDQLKVLFQDTNGDF